MMNSSRQVLPRPHDSMLMPNTSGNTMGRKASFSITEGSKVKKEIQRAVQRKQDQRYKAVLNHFRLRKTSFDESNPIHIRNSTTRESINNSIIQVVNSMPTRKGIISSLTTPINPDSNFNRFREALILLCVIFQTFYVPFTAAFSPPQTETSLYMDIFFDLTFVTDFVLSFNTSFMKNKLLITSRKHIALRYIKSWFIVDFVSSVPVDLIVLFAYGPNAGQNFSGLSLLKSLRLPRLLRLLRLVRFVKIVHLLHIRPSVMRWLLYSRHSNLIRLAQMILMIVLISHFMACAWNGIGADESWFSRNNLEDASIGTRYASAFYHAVLLIQGEQIEPTTPAEQLYCITAIIFGSVILAVIFGNVAMLVANFNANSTNYRNKMELLFENMNQMKLPTELQQRIHEYYNYIWKEYKSLNGNLGMFIPELSRTLGLEVVLFLRMELILKVPFLRECSPDILQELVFCISSNVYLPNDYIVHIGEIGNELFLLNRGECEITIYKNIINSQAKKPIGITHTRQVDSIMREYVVKNIRQGDSFGEMALIMNYRRTANIRAKTFVEVCTLKRQDFQGIILRYKDDRTKILKLILKDHLQQNMIPLPTELIKKLSYRKRRESKRRSGISDMSDIHSEVTVDEATDVLVELINETAVDDSIRVGIHDTSYYTSSHFVGKHASTEDGSDDENKERDNTQTVQPISKILKNIEDNQMKIMKQLKVLRQIGSAELDSQVGPLVRPKSTSVDIIMEELKNMSSLDHLEELNNSTVDDIED